MYVALVVSWGNKGTRTPKAKAQLNLTFVGETAEEVGSKALLQLNGLISAYPAVDYEVLVGELTYTCELPKPQVSLIPVSKASSY